MPQGCHRLAAKRRKLSPAPSERGTCVCRSSLPLGSGPLEAQHLFFGFLCFVAYWLSVLRAAYTTMYDRYPFSVGHVFLFLSPGPSTTCCSDCFLVELVLRLGLNSHSHHPEGFPSTRSSLSAYFRRSAARDDSLVSSVMLSLLALFTLA